MLALGHRRAVEFKALHENVLCFLDGDDAIFLAAMQFKKVEHAFKESFADAEARVAIFAVFVVGAQPLHVLQGEVVFNGLGRVQVFKPRNGARVFFRLAVADVAVGLNKVGFDLSG